MSAEAYYFSQYSSEVSVPVGPIVTTSVHPAEAAYFAFYSSNCTPVVQSETPTAVREVPTGRPEIRQRTSYVSNMAAGASVPDGVKSRSEEGKATVAMETPWPSETFDEVPTGTMSLGGFLDTLMKNVREASTWKPAGYLKTLAEKVFTFSVIPTVDDSSPNNPT